MLASDKVEANPKTRYVPLFNAAFPDPLSMGIITSPFFDPPAPIDQAF